MKALFTISGAESYKPTAENFLQSLKAEFSEVGSKAKTLEINAYKYFSDYIMDLGVTEVFCICMCICNEHLMVAFYKL